MLTPEIIKEGGKITLAFSGAFLFNVLVQVQGKIQSAMAHKRAKQAGTKEKYNRFSDEIMIPSDRSVGNFIEWQGLFLSLFWVNAALTGKEMWLGWVYVGIRFLYPLLAISGGVTSKGPRPLIFFATGPGYVVLLRLGYLIYKAL
jgi:hypothetical protein